MASSMTASEFRNSERIFVIDDDDDQRRAAGNALAHDHDAAEIIDTGFSRERTCSASIFFGVWQR